MLIKDYVTNNFPKSQNCCDGVKFFGFFSEDSRHQARKEYVGNLTGHIDIPIGSGRNKVAPGC